MEKKSEFNRQGPVFLAIVTIFPVFIVAYFYISHTGKGWFLQDDFGFMAGYAATPAFQQLFDFSNFGRFVSRNLYWYLSGKLFSSHAQYYFALNFFIISSTSYLIFKLFSSRLGGYAGIVGGLLYFCSPAVITAYVWLSNSQHLLGHFFAILFIYQYLRARRSAVGGISLIQAAALLSILLAGMLSNIFVGLVLSLPATYFLADGKVREDRRHWLLLAIGSIMFAVFVFKLSPYQTEAYATNYGIETLRKNLVFYFINGWLSVLWLAVALSGAVVSWRFNCLFEAWLFLASPIFLFPFILLRHQRYLQYGTLAYFFLAVGCWALFCALIKAKPRSSTYYYAGATISIVMLWLAMAKIRQFELAPPGADQRELVSQLKTFAGSEGRNFRNYCFQSSRVVENKTGVKIWDYPPEWWGVNFGQAFSLLVDPTKTYLLKGEAKSCDVTFVMDRSRLEKITE